MTRTWRDGCNPAEWARDEYKLLSDHYFHEDGTFWKIVSIFGSINGALLAFLGSTFVAENAPGRVFIPLVGIVLCFAWLAALIRVREWRLYVEARIKAIEEELNDHWKLEGATLLDIRRMQGWAASAPPSSLYNVPYRIFRNAPASATLLFLPIMFAAIWCLSLVEYWWH
jgi:hypothetical protein